MVNFDYRAIDLIGESLADGRGIDLHEGVVVRLHATERRAGSTPPRGRLGDVTRGVPLS